MFLEADVALVLDLQNLLHEKKNDFSFTDVKCFHEVMKHKVTCTDMVVSGSATTELEASKFEEMEFNLTCQKLEADMQAVQIYRSKSECHESRLYHFRQEHLRKRRCQAREAVATLWTGPSRSMAFVSSLHEFLAYITDVRRELLTLPCQLSWWLIGVRHQQFVSLSSLFKLELSRPCHSWVMWIPWR